jgi:hypothetical protein
METPRLGALLAPPPPAPPPPRKCELCRAACAPDHRHVLDLRARLPLCVCRACALLLDRPAAGGDHYRLIPEHPRRIHDLDLDEQTWTALGLPVELAFLVRSTSAGRVVAHYPGPMGVTESTLDLAAWGELEAANPVLAALEPDTEALLVSRVQGAAEHWLLGLDDCYRLVGLIRSCWRGRSGGDEVWSRLPGFFTELGSRGSVMDRFGAPSHL